MDLHKLYYELQPHSITENQEKLPLLLNKQSKNVDLILLQTSFIRKLYSYNNNHEFYSMEFNANVLEILFSQLKSSCNQYVLFTTSKALVSVFTVLPVQIMTESVADSLAVALSCDHTSHSWLIAYVITGAHEKKNSNFFSIFFHGLLVITNRDIISVTGTAIYCLQTITELLKTLRKSRNISMVDSCVSLVVSRWSNLLIPATAQCCESVMIHLILDQYLSLIMECLRCKESLPPMALTILKPLLPTILRSLMKCSPVTLVLCSVKLIDTLKKIILLDFNDSSVSCLEVVLSDDSFIQLQSYITGTVLMNWYQHVSVVTHQSFVLPSPCPTITDALHSSLNEASPLVETLLRKYLVFCFLLMSCVFKERVNPLKEVLFTLKSLAIQTFHLSDQMAILCVQKSILNLAMEEDGCLVAILIHILKLSNAVEDKSIVKLVCNIHCFFIHFMYSIAYDSNTLLDLIISTETNFDVFFSDYLQLISSDDGGSQLIQSCHLIGPTILTDYSTGDNDEELSLITECLSCLYTQLDNARDKGLVQINKVTPINQILELIENMAP